MIPFSINRVSLRHIVIAMCSAAIVALATSASARPLHHGERHPHARAHQVKHHAKHHKARRAKLRKHRRARRASRWERNAARLRNPQVADANASISPVSAGFGGFSGFGNSNIVAEARRYIGRGNPTGRSNLWCARFMNMVLKRAGHTGTGSDMAHSFASYGRRISGPQVGAIAVMSRGRRGGHVGVVSGVDASGNPIIISGNHGNRVAEATYPRGRVYAYVMPAG